MKAVAFEQHGGPEVLGVREMADPRPAAGEVLVDVRAAALNHLDIWVRRGGRAELQMPHVLGSDAAGMVAELGERAHGFETGQPVLIYPGLPCGCCRFCRAGEQSQCVDFGIVGMQTQGTFAEKLAVPARCLRPKPDHLDFAEAATLGIAYTTAWRMLTTRAGLQPGETVLIHGIGGGVALAALQITKALSARAVVTSSSDQKLARAAQLGADEGINYRTTDDVARRVRDLTDGAGVDVAVDSVGAATWPVDLDAVRKGGRVVICGVTTGAEATTDLQKVYWNQLSLLGSTMGSDEDFRSMLRFLEAAELHPVIDSVHPLEDARKATERMEAGRQFGKIVLEIG